MTDANHTVNHLQRRIIAIHDLCGLGHSSLAVALPIISAFGHQVLPVPTAVLSSQTDGFTDYSQHDLTATLSDYLTHWQKVGVRADALYSGYLANPRQMQHVAFCARHLLAEHALVLIDPVLGDGGRLYSHFDQEMVTAMRELIRCAHIITPNITELCLLSDLNPAVPLSDADLRAAVRHLSAEGPKVVVVTSFASKDNELHTLCYERAGDCFSVLSQPRIPAHYPGTGDLFASVLLGRLMQDAPLTDAAQTASAFVSRAIALALEARTPPREGVPFEALLHPLSGGFFPKLSGK